MALPEESVKGQEEEALYTLKRLFGFAKCCAVVHLLRVVLLLFLLAEWRSEKFCPVWLGGRRLPPMVLAGGHSVSGCCRPGGARRGDDEDDTGRRTPRSKVWGSVSGMDRTAWDDYL